MFNNDLDLLAYLLATLFLAGAGLTAGFCNLALALFCFTLAFCFGMIGVLFTTGKALIKS